MSKKIILFSDSHFHIFEDFSKPDDEYVNDRFRAQIDTLKEVFRIAREKEADIVFGGDLFHRRSSLEDVVFNNVYRVFAENNDVRVHLVRGNHDAKDNTTDTEHWLETFQYLPNVTVSSVPDAVYLDGVMVYNIPYSDDDTFLKEKISEFAERARDKSGPNGDEPSILVAHIGVEGSEVGKHSHRLAGAFGLADLYPDSFDYVALGHYHKRQYIGGTSNTFYIGNSIQNSFSDEGQEKGVMLIDFEKGGRPEFIPIKNKQFVTLTTIDGDTQDIVANNYVRFVLPQELAKAVEIYKEGNDNVRVEVVQEFKSETRIDISVDSTEMDIVEAYTTEHFPDIVELSKEILKEAMVRGA